MLEDRIYYRLKDSQIPNNYLRIGYNSNNKDELRKIILSYLINCNTLMEGDNIHFKVNSLTLDYLLEYIGVEIEESFFPFNQLSLINPY